MGEWKSVTSEPHSLVSLVGNCEFNNYLNSVGQFSEQCGMLHVDQCFLLLLLAGGHKKNLI